MDPLFPLENKCSATPTILISSTFTAKLSLAHNSEAVVEIAKLSKFWVSDEVLTLIATAYAVW